MNEDAVEERIIDHVWRRPRCIGIQGRASLQKMVKHSHSGLSEMLRGSGLDIGDDITLGVVIVAVTDNGQLVMVFCQSRTWRLGIAALTSRPDIPRYFSN